MKKRRKIQRIRRRILPLGLLLLLPRFGAAQVTSVRPPATSLEDILLRLEDNVDRYLTLVPNFFCKEHVVSTAQATAFNQYTATDSTFRIAHGPSGNLIERREINAINGTPASGQHISGPVLLGGVFSDGLITVSEKGKVCMQYALEPTNPGRPGRPYVVAFKTLAGTEKLQECVLKEDGEGKVVIDPTAMQVRHLELVAPHHRSDTGAIGVWKIAVDYAPVRLGEQTFWMPSVLHSMLTTHEFGVSVTYAYFARYYDYHRMEVTSRIIPNQ